MSIKSWKAVVIVLAASSLFVVNPALAPADDMGAATAQKARFKNLSNREEQTIIEAIPKVNRLVEESLDKLEDNPRSDNYEKWFGTWRANRYDRVVAVYEAISDDADYATYDGDCRNENHAAKVVPGRGNYIKLCPGFWGMRLSDMALVLLHELSHVMANGGAEDFVYDADNCKVLAENNPDRAVRNADSYMFFADDAA